ncbi:MAG: diaminopimelate decarboxylase [Pseudomonadota bacterium]|jgi:diaminopimelate decarboxylase
MSFFAYRDGVLHAEQVSLARIADEVGTPVHVYSADAIRAAANAFARALAALPVTRLAFAMKANPNTAVLTLLAECGYGADIVSGGELRRAVAAGMKPCDIVFSGVGKTDDEMVAALDVGIGQFNLELEEEGQVLSALAKARGVRAPAVLRVNPHVDVATHPKIKTATHASKFGVSIDDVPAMYDRLARLEGLDLRGLALHIGSQIRDIEPLERAFARIGELIRILRNAGHRITQVDLGGGLGIAYATDDIAPTPGDYADMVGRVTAGWNVGLTFEPGRVLVGAAGVLLTRVIWVKPGVTIPYVIVDAAMNDLARPAMYDAYHRFESVSPRTGRMLANIAGPVCETGDTFARDREIDEVERGDLVVLHTTGAYGAAMASTYNCRPISPQVLVDGERYAIVGERTMPVD